MANTRYAPTQPAPTSYADTDVIPWLISGVPYAQREVAKAYAETAYAWANCRGRKLSHRTRRKHRNECRSYVRDNARQSAGGAVLVYVLSKVLEAIVEGLLNWLLRDTGSETAWHAHLYKDAPNVDLRSNPAEEADPAGAGESAPDEGEPAA